MKHLNNKYTKWLFLYGLGSATKVNLFGVIAISELVAFFAAPILLMQHSDEMRRNGILPVLFFPILMVAGNYIVIHATNESLIFFIKNSAMYYSLFAQTVVLYYLFSRCMRGFGWWGVGTLLSQIISAFALNPRVVVTGSGQYSLDSLSIEESVNNVLFWFPKINSALTLPLKFDYLGLPTYVSVGLVLLCVVITIMISSSGRSACGMLFLAAAIMVIGRRSRKRMRNIGKHIVLFLFVGLFAATIIKNIYVYTARNGLLGEEAKVKFNNQIRSTSLLGVLMGGRSEFFVGLKAMFEHPILGFIEGNEDRHGYYRDFVNKYGSDEDIAAYEASVIRRQQQGVTAETIPIHSSIQQFWSYSGISGLLFWCWVLYLMYMYFRKYAAAIPQWFGCLAVGIPGSVFTIFFNPYNRVGFPVTLAALLVVRAVYQGKLRLPMDMEIEAQKHER